MGEAKARRKAHSEMMGRHPGCIYCADENAATTVEHMPPIAMFDQRQRPKGLEFPTCKNCNQGTRLADLVASLMGRMYPNSDSEFGRDELQKLLNAVSNNVPGLLEEMQVGRAGQKLARRSIPNMPVDASVLRANGPIMTSHMRTFAGKLGFALHFEAHGASIPKEGGVQPMYFTNVNAARGELPMEIINLLPSSSTLQQGKKHVRDQFTYAYLLTEERRHSVFYAVFRSSFAVAAVTALDRSEFLMKNEEKFPIIIPGDFRK